MQDQTSHNHTHSSQEFSDVSKSISLIDQLRKQFNGCNLPRQMKSIFTDQPKTKSTQSNNFFDPFLSAIPHDSSSHKKMTLNDYDKPRQIAQTEYGIPLKIPMHYSNLQLHDIYEDEGPEYQPPSIAVSKDIPIASNDQNQISASQKKSLRECIYDKIIKAKREKYQLIKQQQKLKTEASANNIFNSAVNEATFRPTNLSTQPKASKRCAVPISKIKEIISKKMIDNYAVEEITHTGPTRHKAPSNLTIPTELNTYSEDTIPEESTGGKSTRRSITKYQQILHNLRPASSRSSKQNNRNILNRQSSSKLLTHSSSNNNLTNNQKQQQQKQQQIKITDKFNETKDLRKQLQQLEQQGLRKQRSLTQLSFHQRQRQLLESKNEKAARFSIQKQKQQLSECTFKPRLTPYKQDKHTKEYSSYAQLHQRKVQMQQILTHRG